jgi:hypothetical protein
MKLRILQIVLLCLQQSVQLLNAARMNGLLKTTFVFQLLRPLIKNPKTKQMIEACKFSHAFQIIKVLERRYNTTTKRRNRLARWLFTRSNKKHESLAPSSLIVSMLLR